MDKIKPLVWISLIGLFIAFGVICVLRIVFRKNPGILRYKLKIGGIILTLSGLMLFNGCTNGIGVTCYTTDTSAYFRTPSVDVLDSMTNVNLNVTNQVRFQLYSHPAITLLSYQLADSNNVFIESNDIAALDGTFDSDTEEFHIFLPTTLTNGSYQLLFYQSYKTNQMTNNLIGTFEFKVTNF